MRAEHLSTALFRETRGISFFRVLSGKNAPFYVDVLDQLEAESSERADGMACEEVIALIIETLERHPGFEFDPDAEGVAAVSQSSLKGTKRMHTGISNTAYESLYPKNLSKGLIGKPQP